MLRFVNAQVTRLHEGTHEGKLPIDQYVTDFVGFQGLFTLAVF